MTRTCQTYFLLLVCLLMLAVAVFPHHHHADGICLHTECAANDEPSDLPADGETEGCDACCVTHIRCSHRLPEMADLQPDYTFYTCIYPLFTLLKQPDGVPDPFRETSEYRERLHAVCLPHGKGMRAPPCRG